MTLVHDNGKYVHIDSRFKLYTFIELVKQGVTKPIIVGGTHNALAQAHIRRDWQVILLYLLPRGELYVYRFDINNSRYSVCRRKFTLSSFLKYLEHVSSYEGRWGRNSKVITAIVGIHNTLRGILVNTPRKSITIYPSRGDRSWLLDEFLGRFEEVTGIEIPLPKKE